MVDGIVNLLSELTQRRESALYISHGVLRLYSDLEIPAAPAVTAAAALAVVTAVPAATASPAAASQPNVETDLTTDSNGREGEPAGQDDYHFGGDLSADSGNAAGFGEQSGGDQPWPHGMSPPLSPAAAASLARFESGGAIGGPTMAPPIDPRLLGLNPAPTRPRPIPAYNGAGPSPGPPLFRLSPHFDALDSRTPAFAGSLPAWSFPPFTPQPNAAQLALICDPAHVTPVTTPTQHATIPPAVPTPSPPASPVPPPAATDTMPLASPVLPPPAAMFFPLSRPFTQPPVDQMEKPKPARKTPPSKKSASKTSHGKAAKKKVIVKAAQDVAVAKDVAKKHGRPLKQAPPLADVTNDEASEATPAYTITNNNRARARQAVAEAKAAEAEKARAAQMEKGWMPGLEEGTVVILRARKPRAHPDGTLPPRVGQVAAARLDASEKALLERASASKRKAAAAPSSAKAPPKKKRKA
ncbi:hypothetical protein K438DRAFT_1971867 [Mycena galopus ATCC 62051]|nr:hypothetical protein K438DRAFT_1971867 [Mycena galopus ATCC 62051]